MLLSHEPVIPVPESPDNPAFVSQIACHLVSLVLASLISIAIYNFDCAKAVYQARDDALAKAAPFLPTLPSAPLPLPGQSTTSLAMAATPTSTFEDFWRSRCQPDFVLSYRLFQGGLAAFMFAVTLTAFVQFRVSAVTGIVTAIVCLVVLLWMLMCVTPRWGAAATAAAGPSHPLHPLRFHPGMTEPLSESAQLLARVPPLPATLSPYIPVASSSSSSPSSATSLSQSAPRRLVGRSSSNSSSASRGHDR